MPPRPSPSRVAAALDYLQRLKSGVGEFVGGVGSNLADRARAAGGLAYEALTSDPNIGRMTTAEFSQAAADRAPTPRLDQAAQDIGTIGRAIVTQPVETGKAIVRGEVERAQQAMTSPQAAGQYAGSLIDPTRLAAALRHRIPISELDVYHGTPHKYAPTEANPLGEFDASKIGTGEGAQAYGHGVYLAEAPEVAEGYKKTISQSMTAGAQRRLQTAGGDLDKAIADTEARAAKYRQGGAKSYAEAAEEDLRGLRQFKETGEWTSGSLYKADLPDEMIDRMLDWDKPLSEQHPEVQRIISEEIKRIGGGSAHTGERAYRELMFEARMQGSKSGSSAMKNNLEAVEASKRLQALGIPGIKYLDAGSRGQGGSGTRNFVVFPGEEKKVRILERNGQPAPERIAQALEAASSKAAKVEPQPFGLQGYLDDDLRRVKQNFFSQYGLEEGKQFSKDYEVIELSKLKPTENTNESKIQSLMKTMREEGNAKDNPIPPIIVDSEGNILDGHHRYEAAKRLGAKYVPVVELFDKQKGPSFSE